ncbi:hypothetical protein H9P43_001283 [Blastocladiella emersonii ATCC 22665]|nr:hypothetical protein H9P43_001283 [Blastocladiella emersonii ATCC 22665]
MDRSNSAEPRGRQLYGTAATTGAIPALQRSPLLTPTEQLLAPPQWTLGSTAPHLLAIPGISLKPGDAHDRDRPRSVSPLRRYADDDPRGRLPERKHLSPAPPRVDALGRPVHHHAPSVASDGLVGFAREVTHAVGDMLLMPHGAAALTQPMRPPTLASHPSAPATMVTPPPLDPAAPVAPADHHHTRTFRETVAHAAAATATPTKPADLTPAQRAYHDLHLDLPVSATLPADEAFILQDPFPHPHRLSSAAAARASQFSRSLSVPRAARARSRSPLKYLDDHLRLEEQVAKHDHSSLGDLRGGAVSQATKG